VAGRPLNCLIHPRIYSFSKTWTIRAAWPTSPNQTGSIFEASCRSFSRNSRIDSEIVAVLADNRLTESDKRKECYALVLDRDEVVADCFDDWRRSAALDRLMALRQYDLLKPEHLARLSPATANILSEAFPAGGRTATITVGRVTKSNDGEFAEVSGTIGPFTSKEVKEIPAEVKCSGCGQPLLVIKKDAKKRKLLCEILTSTPPEVVNAAERVGSLTCYPRTSQPIHFSIVMKPRSVSDPFRLISHKFISKDR
jgi:hypothetical protein